MNFLKQQILRLESGGGKNLPWRRAFNLALQGGGGNPLQDLAENTPELFLKVLDFTENKDIVPLHFVNLAKDIKWDVLLRNKFPEDFETKEDIKAKFEWLHEYEPRDIHVIANSLKSKKRGITKEKGTKRRKSNSEQGVEMFLLLDERMVESIEGKHELGHNGDKIERDHDCQWN